MSNANQSDFVEQHIRAGGVLHGASVGGHSNSPDVRAKASLYIATRARDADDCRLLLDVLGLLP